MFIVVLLFTILPPGAYVAMGLRQAKEDEVAPSPESSDPEAYGMASRSQQT